MVKYQAAILSKPYHRLIIEISSREYKCQNWHFNVKIPSFYGAKHPERESAERAGIFNANYNKCTES